MLQDLMHSESDGCSADIKPYPALAPIELSGSLTSRMAAT